MVNKKEDINVNLIAIIVIHKIPDLGSILSTVHLFSKDRIIAKNFVLDFKFYSLKKFSKNLV